MKVAVCLSGQLRSWKDCHESLFNNIIHPTDADLYVYAWDWNHSRCKKYEIHPVTKRFDINDGTTDEFLNIYKPRKYKFVSCEDFLTNSNFGTLYSNNLLHQYPDDDRFALDRMMCMFYSISKCFNMLDFSAYDVIFRCRTEINYKEKINEDHLSLAINGNLIIPHGLDSRGIKTPLLLVHQFK